jgi:hypothetical protein
MPDNLPPREPHRAVDYIIKHAKEYADAKAKRVHLEEFRKSKKALLMKAALAKGYEAANAQDREAYADPEYQQLLDGIKEAIEVEEFLRWRLEACKMRVDIWRTEQANARMEIKATE